MPATETVLAELRAATGPGIDPRVREDYARLIEQVPTALHRDGQARAPGGGSLHLTTSAVVVDRALDSLVLVHHRRAGLWVMRLLRQAARLRAWQRAGAERHRSRSRPHRSRLDGGTECSQLTHASSSS